MHHIQVNTSAVIAVAFAVAYLAWWGGSKVRNRRKKGKK